MEFLKVFPEKVLRPMKPLHGVGEAPVIDTNFSAFSYLRDAGIPFSRLHDMGFDLGGRYVDIPLIFRDFDADPSDPAAYDFAFTDLLMQALDQYGVEPFFRLGVSIENYQKVKKYFIDPPKDNLKWAKICEGIIRHYTEGWANGFHFTVRYFEIWNEPENGGPYSEGCDNQMWTGTMEEYFALYETASKYLKGKFPHLKFGGYASCGFYRLIPKNTTPKEMARHPEQAYYMTFFEEFLKYVKKTGSPLDFFSWHSYSRPKNTVLFAEYARKKLDEYGFFATESTCNEWNPQYKLYGTVIHAVLCAEEMIRLQSCGAVDSAMFYDARCSISRFSGLFTPKSPVRTYPAYEAFVAFNELYRLGNEVAVETELSPEDMTVLAASDGKVAKVMIANPSPYVERLYDVEADGMKPVACRMLNPLGEWEEKSLPAAGDYLPIEGQSLTVLTFEK